MRALAVGFLAVFLVACSTVAEHAQRPVYEPTRVVVSTGEPTINPDNEAVSFVIGENTLYVSSEWGELGESPLFYLCEIYDGEGSLAFVMGGRLFSNEKIYYYQSNYSPNARIDAPGKWKAIIYANGRAVATKTIFGKRPDGYRYESI